MGTSGGNGDYSSKAYMPPYGALCIMVDEKAWAVITVFIVGVVTTLELLGGIPTGVVPIVELLAVVLLLAVGLMVLGEIRDEMRNTR